MTPATAARSALIAPIAVPPRLASIRAAGDRSAALGVPPHVTILFPFVPAAALAPAVRDAVGSIAGAVRPFTARFALVERRERMVWLRPADPAPFLGLTAAAVARWPELPPYGGIHGELIAHLTLLESDDAAALDDAAAAAVGAGPFEAEVRGLAVIAEDAVGAWHERWRIPLGGPALR